MSDRVYPYPVIRYCDQCPHYSGLYCAKLDRGLEVNTDQWTWCLIIPGDCPLPVVTGRLVVGHKGGE